MLDLHVILDIDQTMIDSMNLWEYNRIKDNIRAPDLREGDRMIWMRPYLKEFLTFLDKNVKHISVWTNGNSTWLFHVVKNILTKYMPIHRFHLLLSINHSTPTMRNNTKIYLKDMQHILRKFPKDGISLKNSILLDDDFFNCSHNKYNSIPLKKYHVVHEHKMKKKDLYYAIEILKVLNGSDDVSRTLQKVYDDLDDYNKLFTVP